MKKMLALILALMLALSLAACGGDKPESPASAPASSGGDTPSSGSNEGVTDALDDLAGDDGAWFDEDASGEDLFARHGLTDVVPEGCLHIRRWTEDPITDSFCRTNYTFEMDHDPTPEERAVYFGKIFDQVLAASDNGKVYALDFDFETMDGFLAEMTGYEDTAPNDYSYYRDGAFWDVSVSSGSFDDYFVFSLEINTSIINPEIRPAP